MGAMTELWFWGQAGCLLPPHDKQDAKFMAIEAEHDRSTRTPGQAAQGDAARPRRVRQDKLSACRSRSFLIHFLSTHPSP